jgi:hypothetical protein
VSEATWNFTVTWPGQQHRQVADCRHVLLLMRGIDTFGHVLLNGQHVLAADNAHRCVCRFSPAAETGNTHSCTCTAQIRFFCHMVLSRRRVLAADSVHRCVQQERIWVKNCMQMLVAHDNVTYCM